MGIITRRLSPFVLSFAGWLLLTSPSAARQTPALPAVLKESIAYYATLSSYADTGTVTQEVPGMVDSSRFTTYFRRATRDLVVDYQALSRKYLDLKSTTQYTDFRTIIWMAKGRMQRFDFRTKEHDEIDDGRQVKALADASYGTLTASIVVPSLLYSQARLPSSILQLESAELAGSEAIDGHNCHKVTGIAAAYFPNGRRTTVRPVTVWIDAETKLIRRVTEDPQKGGSGVRLTLTYEPRANPAIEDAKFAFTPPVR